MIVVAPSSRGRGNPVLFAVFERSSHDFVSGLMHSS